MGRTDSDSTGCLLAAVLCFSWPQAVHTDQVQSSTALGASVHSENVAVRDGTARDAARELASWDG